MKEKRIIAFIGIQSSLILIFVVDNLIVSWFFSALAGMYTFFYISCLIKKLLSNRNKLNN